MKNWIPTKEKIITFRITKAMNKDLEFKAYQMQKSPSEVIRTALEIFLSGASDKGKQN